MKQRYSYMYSFLIALAFVLITMVFAPATASVMFLLATLLVSVNYTFLGTRTGFWSYFVMLFILFFIPTEPVLTLGQFVAGFITYTATSILLIYLTLQANRFKRISLNLQEDISKHMYHVNAIVQSSDDAIISKDLNGIIQTWNKGAENLFGFTEEEAKGKSIKIIFPEGQDLEEEKILTTLKKGEKISHYETVRKTKHGMLVDVSLSVSPIKDFEGRVIGISKIARDITERKRQERELERNTERYKAFIENSEDAIWLVEYNPPIDTTLPIDIQADRIIRTGVVTEINAKMLELYKIESADKILGRKTVEISPKTDEAVAFCEMFIEQGYNVSNYESKTLIPTTGQVRYGSTSFKGIIVNNKLARGWVVQREITERKLQEEELEKSKERYKTFIETSEEAIWRTEFPSPISTKLPVQEQIDKFFNEGYIAEANQATANVFDKPNVDSILNKKLVKVGTRTPNDDKFMTKFIKNGYSLDRVESTQIKENGEKVYWDSSVKGILEGENWVRAWVVRRDVTKEKEYSLERERLLQETNSAKKQAEQANRDKDNFLANLSHELRTPLVSIVGYAGILTENTSKEDLKKGLEVIKKNGKLQLDLIEDLLDVSRALSKSLILDKSTFDLHEIMCDAKDSFKPKAEDKGIEIVCDCQPLIVTADKKRITQIITNLVANSVRFTDKGKITLSCGEKNGNFYFTVQDTGVGIAKKHYKAIFKRFYQVDSGVARRGGGVGLGLYIVKNLVDLHQGKVILESVLGRGTIFTVTIPKISNPVTPPEQALVGVNVLVVEDNEDVRNLLKIVLELEGAIVSVAETADEGLSLINSHKFDLYLFDVALPEKDGLELMRELRMRGDKTASVAISAYRQYEKQTTESGYNLFLLKPINKEELLKVKKLLL